MGLIQCVTCEKQISPNAGSCPNCGEPVVAIPESVVARVEDDSSIILRVMFWIFGLPLLLIGVIIIGVNLDNGADVIMGLTMLSLYFVPWSIAASRGHHNSGAIFALNLFLGWTFLGWILAFVWGCTAVKKVN